MFSGNTQNTNLPIHGKTSTLPHNSAAVCVLPPFLSLISNNGSAPGGNISGINFLWQHIFGSIVRGIYAFFYSIRSAVIAVRSVSVAKRRATKKLKQLFFFIKTLTKKT
jgi:hypothetical protein